MFLYKFNYLEATQELLKKLFFSSEREILVQIFRWKPQEYFVYFKVSKRER